MAQISQMNRDCWKRERPGSGRLWPTKLGPVPGIDGLEPVPVVYLGVREELAAVLQLGQEPQELSVQPDQCDHQAERAVPFHVLGGFVLGASGDEVEIEQQVE